MEPSSILFDNNIEFYWYVPGNDSPRSSECCY